MLLNDMFQWLEATPQCTFQAPLPQPPLQTDLSEFREVLADRISSIEACLLWQLEHAMKHYIG